MAYREVMDLSAAQPSDQHPDSASNRSPDDDETRPIADSLAAVRERIRSAAESAGRDPREIRLLPVSKTVSADRLRAAAAAGCRELGENKVQEAAGKAEALADLGIRWSVIGHLQRNKAKDVAAFAHEFQALDSLRLAAALDRRLQELSRPLDVLVQVNTSGEESKSGVTPQQLPELLRGLREFSGLRVTGLMTIAAASRDEDQVRACFRTLRDLRDQALETDPEAIGAGQLSMGMSGDLELAIQEGSTCVRVGRSIFGARPAPAGR